MLFTGQKNTCRGAGEKNGNTFAGEQPIDEDEHNREVSVIGKCV